MHPIEHLRHVARSGGLGATDLVQEAAAALGSLRGDSRNLVIACRRIVERHPDVGQLWWLCASLLTAPDPRRLAWELADALEHDPSLRKLVDRVPEGATVALAGDADLVVGIAEARSDLVVRCAQDDRSWRLVQRLARRDLDVEVFDIDDDDDLAAVAGCDVAIFTAVAASTRTLLAAASGARLAAAAREAGVDVWCLVGLGCALPDQYVAEIAARAGPSLVGLSWSQIAMVGRPDRSGATDTVGLLQPDCSFAPELLRTSPI